MGWAVAEYWSMRASFGKPEELDQDERRPSSPCRTSPGRERGVQSSMRERLTHEGTFAMLASARVVFGSRAAPHPLP